MRGNQPDASMPQARCPSAEPSLFPWLRSQENAQATRGADDQKTGCHRSFFSLNRVGLERRRASARMPSRASAPQRIASLRAPKAGYWHRLLSVSRPRETERRRNAAGMVVIHGNPACGVLHVLQHTALASWLPAPARQRQLARASPRATPFAASRPRPAHACAGTNFGATRRGNSVTILTENQRFRFPKTRFWESRFSRPWLGASFISA